MNINKKCLWIIVFLGTFGVFFSGTTLFAASKKFQSTPKSKKKEYVIVLDLAFAPFEYQENSGKYVGIDVDLIDEIAALFDFKIKKKFVGFQAAVDQVQTLQADGIMAGVNITLERQKSFLFSRAYYDSNIRLTVKAGNPNHLKDYKDLKGKAVGAKIGTVSADFLKANENKYGYKLKLFDTADGMYDSLNINDVWAIMDDEPVVAYAIRQGKKIELINRSKPIGKFGFAVKKGQNEELIQMFNEGLAYLKKTSKYQKIIDKYTKSKKQVDMTDETTFIGMLKNNYQPLLEGLGKTMILALISFALAIIFGIIFGLFSVAPVKALRILATIYVDAIRGIPLMVLIFFIFYGIPNLLGIKAFSAMFSGIIVLTLNSSAYIAEIVRGGIEAVPIGQMEASRSLGLGYGKTMKKIILPQAIRLMLPSLINQFVITLKDTTIISVIGIVELLRTSQIIMARNLQSFKIFTIVGLIFLIVITTLTKFAKVLEKKVKI
ncbi:MAG: ABC transporter substrate-binding protein/permease [Streptococcaceae bacterium]|jgi:polar amino acid transport system substrate-binding protein|nr:ABC transporter substrate-binding protein/permease [Streptococcaceae bacterium]